MQNTQSTQQQENSSKKINKKKAIKLSLYIILAIFLLFVLLSALSIKPAINAYKSSINGQNDLIAAEQAIKKQDISQAAIEITKSKENFESAQKNLRYLAWLRIIPYAGIQYNAANHLVRAAAQITSGLSETLIAAEKISAPIEFGKVKTAKSITANTKKEILKNIYESIPTFQLALSQIELAEIELNQMPKIGTLKKINDAKQKVSDNMPMLKEYMTMVVKLSKIIPSIAGYPNEQTYLFLLQNNSELRPGGGFIGTYGIIKTKDGELTQLKTDNTYNLDQKSNINVEPPWQLKEYVDPNMKSWYLRDSNWSPDFPTNAQKAVWFYQNEGGAEKEFNGVVAITPTFIEYLLEVTGPIEAKGETFNAENITDRVQYLTTGLYEGKVVILEQTTRKSIIGDLGRNLVKKIFTMKKSEWPKLFEAIQKGFDNKQASVYLYNPDAQKAIEAQGWAGKVNQNTKNNDYLMVVDSNMASLKTDPFMKRTIQYDLKPDGKARVSITYENKAVPSLLTTRYRTWTRIYVPLNSQFVEVDGNEGSLELYPNGKDYEITQELNKTVFGTFINIETQETKTVTFDYILPKNVVDQIKKGEYKLIAQKQNGANKPYLKINFTAPKNINEFSPADLGKLLNNNNVQFETNFQSDKEFIVKF